MGASSYQLKEEVIILKDNIVGNGKKTYSSPRLTEYGSVEGLTEGPVGWSFADWLSGDFGDGIGSPVKSGTGS